MSRLAAYDVRLPCGTDSCRTHHLAHGETCAVCFPDDPPLASVTPIPTRLAAQHRHPAGRAR